MAQLVQARLSNDLYQQLKQICKESQRNIPDMIRWLIAEEYVREFKSRVGTYNNKPAAKEGQS